MLGRASCRRSRRCGITRCTGPARRNGPRIRKLVGAGPSSECLSLFVAMAIGELFILGEDWSLYEEFVPRENFPEDEIRAKHSTRYFSADGRSIYSCPTSIAVRGISLTQLAAYFSPFLTLTDRVQTCQFVNPPDFYAKS